MTTQTIAWGKPYRGLHVRDDLDAPFERGDWFEATAVGAGVESVFEPGLLAGLAWLSTDLLLDGKDGLKLVMELAEGGAGPAFRMAFGLLSQCQARLRFPLSATDQNRWMLPREGAYLKPLCGGAAVDLSRVDRVRLFVDAKGDEAARWFMTPLRASSDEPPLIERPLLPMGALIDALGQSAIRNWPGKSRSREEVTARMHEQYRAAGTKRWPAAFSRWGGWQSKKVEATGFFRTHHDGTRWWLVDPDGCLFWSAGMDCVRSSVDVCARGLEAALTDASVVSGGKTDHLRLNLEHAFGSDWHARWASTTLGFLRETAFNTVANWSEWEVAAQASFPYVRPLDWRGEQHAPRVFRDMPDVFHAAFGDDCRRFAEQLRATRDDPALIGYFLINEPTWGFADQNPAEGMLYTTEQCAARTALAADLRTTYATDATLAEAWGAPVTVAQIERGRWTRRVPDGGRRDLEAFSTRMVEKLFGGLSEACREIDPNHLNLGARYHTVPPPWAVAGMRCFDVFSINCYSERVRRDLAPLCERMNCPALIGEWHFGALDAGLPASGIGRVRDQAARGQAYRVYLEDAASQPWCVGAHWFTLYDQSALGRGDGENYNIGFLDICNRPYDSLARAARLSHERMYAVAGDEAKPFDEAPEYLPKLFY